MRYVPGKLLIWTDEYKQPEYIASLLVITTLGTECMLSTGFDGRQLLEVPVEDMEKQEDYPQGWSIIDMEER